MSTISRFIGRSLLVSILLFVSVLPTLAAPAPNNLLIYCGITMVRPITDIARLFEKQEKVTIAIAQGGSEDLYQSAKKSLQGDLYLPGEPVFRTKHQAEGLLGEYRNLGLNQMGLIVQKGDDATDLIPVLKNDLQEFWSEIKAL